MLGPFPRHIEPCCNTHEHAIVDAAGNPVNMVDYTLALSKFIARSPGLSHDSVHYIEYPAIFGDNFMESHLVDGVHLNNGANEMLANFIFSLLTKLNKPTSHLKKKTCKSSSPHYNIRRIFLLSTQPTQLTMRKKLTTWMVA